MFVRIVVICAFLSCFAQLLTAQIDSSEVTASPYGAIYNHLYYLQDDSYDPERAALSLPPGTANASEQAVRLKKVLDGAGYYVDVNRLPTNSDYVDTLLQEAIYFIDRSQARPRPGQR